MAMIWRGKQAMSLLRRDARQKVLQACLVTERGIKQSMKRGGRTESGAAGEASKIGAFTSAPGEPPRVQTGTLKRGYTHEMHEVLPIGRVGTNVFYAKLLEFGTRAVAARPHVRPVLHALRGTFRTIFGVKTRGL